MTVNQLIAALQAQADFGGGDLEVARYSAEFGDYIPIKIVAKKEAPKLNGQTYVPYGSQENSIVFVSIY